MSIISKFADKFRNKPTNPDFVETVEKIIEVLDPLAKIVYVILTGTSSMGPVMHTACAITQAGRWIAGAVSQSPGGALDRCAQMAAVKSKEMLSEPHTIKVVSNYTQHAGVLYALKEAFKRMP